MSSTRAEEAGKFWRQVAGHSIYHYLRLVNRSSTYETIGLENITAAEATGRPLLWSTWHGLNMPFTMWAMGHRPHKEFSVVAVGDKRFDVLEVVARRLGGEAVPVDMESNSFSGGRSVLKVLRHLQNGHETFLCPDAPAGPAYEPKRGVFYLAKKANAVIVPFGIWTTRAYLMDRWDHNMFPYPFADIKAVVGQPFLVGDEPDETGLRRRVIDSLHQARTDAQRATGIEPWR